MAAPHLTRRGFFKAAAASVPVAAAAVTILSGCTHSSSDSADSEPVVVEDDSATSVTDSYTYVDSTYAAAHEWSLPLGNVLHPGEGTWIPVATAGASASPMVKGSALSTTAMREACPSTAGSRRISSANIGRSAAPFTRATATA